MYQLIVILFRESVESYVVCEYSGGVEFLGISVSREMSLLIVSAPKVLEILKCGPFVLFMTHADYFTE